MNIQYTAIPKNTKGHQWNVKEAIVESSTPLRPTPHVALPDATRRVAQRDTSRCPMRHVASASMAFSPSPAHLILRFSLFLALLLAGTLGVKAADYVLAYVNGGTTYYVARNGTTGVQRVTTFDPTTCIWSCSSNTDGTTAGTLNNSNTYGYLFQTVNGTRYFLGAPDTDLALATSVASNYYRWRTNGTYVYNRYSGTYSYYINLANGVARNTTANTASNARPYQVTISDVAPIAGALTINEPANVLNHTGTYTFTHNTPTYRMGYINYSFNSTNHYFDTDGNSITPANATVGDYTWFISENPYATISSGGVVNVASLPEVDTNVTVTLTANVTGGTPAFPVGTMLTASTEVTILGTLPIAPDITVSGSTATITTDAAGTTSIRYTLDGSDPTATTGTVYSGAIDLSTSGNSPVTIKAVTVRGESVSDVTTQTVTLTLPAPTITADGAAGTATITSSVAGATIYYTTDGSTPTTSSSVYSGVLSSLSAMTTVKAIAVKSGWNTSPVASGQLTIPSGVSGGTVTLFDYEDHNWTYYKGVDATVDGGTYNTKYAGTLYSPNPRNIKITYKANGGAVSIDESETEFVYYKTLEEGTTAGQYPYTVISNPFSKRPNGKGFGGWKIKEGAEYINGYADEATLPLDADIVFTNLPYPSDNCTSAEIELEATWVNLNNITYANGNNITYNVSGGNYETNILVLNRNVTGTITTTSPVTIMMVEPDGSSDYRGTYTFTGNITPNNNGVSKIEFTRWNSTNTVNAGYQNLWIGRGMTTTSLCANLITGYNGTGTVASPQYSIKVESGTYQYFDFYKGHSTYNSGTANTGFTVSGTAANAKITMGNDYDRAKGANSTLEFIYGPMFGYSGSFSDRGNRDNKHTLDLIVKSGTIGSTFFMEGTNTATYLQGGAGQCMYLSSAGSQTNVGTRNVVIEGGDICSIGGGIDSYNNAPSNNSTPNTTTNYERLSLNLRIKGGTIHGNVYGGAAKSPAGGNRVMVMTGGQVKGWFAAGCNGTDDDGGQTYGTSYVYVGGDGSVNSEGSTKVLGYANGGNVYAAGAGRQGATSCGEMTFGTNLVIADDTYVERGIYGGGNYGYALENTSIYITGGTNEALEGTVNGVTTQGSVYGGANQQNGPTVDITMTGGLMKGNVFGGCNTRGTINGKATLNIMGGTVGSTTVEDWSTMAGGRIVKTDIIASDGCVFGGGYGEETNMAQGVEINISQADDEKPTIIYNNVYGGGKLGNVSANATATNDSTYITMTGGTIHGKLFGGGSGHENNETAALVEGNATIHVSGGQIDKAVYGGGELASVGIASDNATGLINILIDGTASLGTDENCKNVYGGGYVYGSGYGKPGLSEFTFVKYATVTIGGNAHVRGSVFGSGENGHVRKDTEVYIKDNCYIGTELSDAEHEIDDNGRGVLIYRGNVYGGGRGIDIYSASGMETYSLTAGRVGGNTFVEVSGGTIYHDVFGGGSLATVGIATIDPSTGIANYTDTSTGNTEVHIKGGVIGYSVNEEKQGFNCGFVYGGCRGLAAAPNTDAVKMAFVHNAKVYIEPGADIKGSVFGGGANGHVKADTYVEISGGSIGTALLADEVGFDDHGVATKSVFRGNVYAGGRGVDLYQQAGSDWYSLTAGAVYGNAELKMTGGHVWHNVYGSGAMASVGTVEAKPTGVHVHDEVLDASGNIVNPDGAYVDYLTGVFTATTGTVRVSITGGTVGDTTPGHEGRNNGRVYGAGRGVSASRADRIASMGYVKETYVTIGTDGQQPSDYSGSAPGERNYPYIYGAVFGGGENGHVKNDTHVNIYSGIVGWPLDEGEGGKHKTLADGSSKNPFRGHVFGGGRGVDPLYHSSSETRSSTAGRVYGHANVTMTGGVVRRAIYGGGLLASVGIYRLQEPDLHIVDEIEDEVDAGKATVTVSGGYIGNVNPDGSALSGTGTSGYVLLAPGDNNGHVFGSSCGMVADNYTEDGVAIDEQYRQMGYSHSTEVNISGGHLYGSIFGSGENGHVWEDARLNISGGTIGSEESTLIYSGNVYGSGRGVDHPNGTISETAGKVRGNTTVNITGGTIWRDVYGGGSLASVGEEGETGDDSHINVTSDPLTTNPYPYATGLTRVYIHGTSATPEVHGSVYGSGRGVASSLTAYRQAAYVKNTLVTIGKAHVYTNVFGGGNAGHVRRNTVVDILADAKVDGNVYGGGAGSISSPTAGLVNHDVAVNIKGGLVGGDVYGGGAIANTNTHDRRNDPSLYADGTTAKAHASTYGNPSENSTCTTDVNLTGGIILGNAYGGGQGVIPGAGATAAEIANAGAMVRGNVKVTLNGTAFRVSTTTDDQGNTIAATGRVFGCNNLNGSPQGTVLVHVLRTRGVTESGGTYSVNDTKPEKGTDTYEVQAVYGGGNLAAYEPWVDDADGQYTGNGSYTHTATGRPLQVVVDGCDEASIEYVYGGGNAASTPSTDVLMYGCYEVNYLFGGGNGKDRINKNETWQANPGANVGFYEDGTSTYGTGEASVEVLGGTIHGVFGGSNTLGNVRQASVAYLDEFGTCPLEIEEVYGGGNEAYMSGNSQVKLGCITKMTQLYGGAKAANVGGDIVLTITSGHFDRVFGGNNISGDIMGSITVNVEETGCHPITIGELYGCGNQAAYTTPAGKTDPTINIKSCTSIGRVFGGGLGSTAVVKGNPTVNINEALGKWKDETSSTYAGTTRTLKDGSTVTLPAHATGKIGSIGIVFGGGNEAKVEGNTNVLVGTQTGESIVFVSPEGQTEAERTHTVEGADVTGNVFGGGNNAEVTGNSNVVIGKSM